MTSPDERAAAVARTIDRLNQRLAEKLAIVDYLRRQARKVNGEALKLHAQIRDLHVQRDAIFHEDDE